MKNQTVIVPSTHTFTWFSYRGVGVEIGHPTEPKDEKAFKYGWTYYLYLTLSHFEDKELSKSLWLKAKPSSVIDRKHYQAYKVDFFDNLDLHGGLTWYSKEYDTQDNKIIKVGCDYSHLWDMKKQYTIEDIKRNAMHSVDCLHDTTTYLVYCRERGCLSKESEGEYNAVHGAFVCNSCKTNPVYSKKE